MSKLAESAPARLPLMAARPSSFPVKGISSAVVVLKLNCQVPSFMSMTRPPKPPTLGVRRRVSPSVPLMRMNFRSPMQKRKEPATLSRMTSLSVEEITVGRGWPS